MNGRNTPGHLPYRSSERTRTVAFQPIRLRRRLSPISLLNQFCSSIPPGKGGPSLETFAQCLAPHGYTQWTSYQPASRFWPFQWIEGAWLLALSALLIAATIWLVQRRAA